LGNYKRSTNNGETWSSDVRLTNDDDKVSECPSIAVNGNNIHVVWDDDRDRNREIYYKQKLNQKPTADTLDFSANHVYKGDIITLYANASDDNDKEDDLTPTFEYKISTSTIWQNACISGITWDSTGWYWKATLTPSDEMEIGMYDFRVKFTDSDGRDSDWREGAEQIDLRVHPIAFLSTSKTNIKEEGTITFNASKSIGKDLVYYFDFGGNTTIDWGYDAVRTHKYSKKGTYIAKLKVRDAYGEESIWDSTEITVKGKGGIPGFEFAFLIIAIATIILLKRRNNKNR
jgi:hypothetical protein